MDGVEGAWDCIAMTSTCSDEILNGAYAHASCICIGSVCGIRSPVKKEVSPVREPMNLC